MSLLFSALYAKCPYYLVLYMQTLLIMYCFICKVSLFLLSAFYAKCPYYVGLYTQSVLIIYSLIYKVPRVRKGTHADVGAAAARL